MTTSAYSAKSGDPCSESPKEPQAGFGWIHRGRVEAKCMRIIPEKVISGRSLCDVVTLNRDFQFLSFTANNRRAPSPRSVVWTQVFRRARARRDLQLANLSDGDSEWMSALGVCCQICIPLTLLTQAIASLQFYPPASLLGNGLVSGTLSHPISALLPPSLHRQMLYVILAQASTSAH